MTVLWLWSRRRKGQIPDESENQLDLSQWNRSVKLNQEQNGDF